MEGETRQASPQDASVDGCHLCFCQEGDVSYGTGQLTPLFIRFSVNTMTFLYIHLSVVEWLPFLLRAPPAPRVLGKTD